MKNKKMIVVIGLAFILMALGIFVAMRHINSDSRAIERTYSSIVWPSYLNLIDKRAQDDRKYDPQLDLLWKYTYAIKGDLSHERIKEDLKSSLQNQGYGHIVEYGAAPPDQYNFRAEGKGIRLRIVVGDKNEPRNKDTVLITAQVSD